ncbi:hypothetical protein A2U01_0106819, partial [Trifolium medium]|nr:hypothetical protein [Trifolium medium]
MMPTELLLQPCIEISSPLNPSVQNPVE